MNDDERLARARILLELGEHDAAEADVVELLDAVPDDLDALNLYAKIKHVRGELSQAIACWAQLHARSPHNELARMHLESLFHLATDPARGAEHVLALGPARGGLQRRPTAWLELEEACRLFVSQKPDAARALCDKIAARNKAKDREVFKLATLAGAWFAELSGQLDLARSVLEALGRARGFEHDTDRILALVRVYERIGTHDTLESAVRLCAHLEQRFTKISLASRLAVLHRRLGDEARAKHHDARWLEAFKERMHLPAFDDVVRVAARSYVPLERLRTVRLSAPARQTHAEPRAQAIAAALQGALGEARALFEASDHPLDRKYLADVAVLEEDFGRAAHLYLEAFAVDPDDGRVLGWLLDHADRAPEIAARLCEPEVALRVRTALDAATRDAPLSATVARRRATFLRIVCDVEALRAAEERAEALEGAAARDAHPIGRVNAAGVYRFVGKAKGIVHQIWADRAATAPGRGGSLASDDVLGNLTPEMRHGVRNVFFAVREWARAKLPHRTRDLLDWNYGYKVTKEDEPSGGLSAGLPTALAFLSVFLQRPVPSDIASSGVIVADAHDVLEVRLIGDAEYKVRGAYNANVRTLLLPAANRPALGATPLVPRAICDEIVRFVPNLDAAVKLVFGDDVFGDG